ncbi:MAG: hypothetical protein HKN12_09910 [Gemmatimonadetes bacterium]|nr:hypothetical protein [Gemmatimonadota bacterium]
MFKVVTALCLSTLVLAAPAAAGEGVPKAFGGEVADLVTLAIREYNELTEFQLPELDEELMEELLAGKVARTRWKQPVPSVEPVPEGQEVDEDDVKTRQRVVAMYLIKRPRDHVWVAALDPNNVPSDKVREVRLSRDGSGDSRWYQLMDLPWPVKNRHWVIDVKKREHVAAATDGRAWEQTWHLVEDGEPIAYEATKAGRSKEISYDDAKGAKYLDANTGAWAMFELTPDLTLLTYQLTVVLGGLLPEGLTARFAMGELESLCFKIEEHAYQIPQIYVDGYETVYGGDGKPIVPPLRVP